MWQRVWAWLTEVAVRLFGHYGSQPIAKPSTEAQTVAPPEKVEEVVESITESELWRQVQLRGADCHEDLKHRS